MKRKDRPHQKEAIRATVKGFKTHKRGQVIMACGTGKTHVGMRVADVMKAQRVIVFVPSIALIAQFVRHWRETGHKAQMLAVCCDGTVAAEAGADDDDLSISQLAKQTGVSVTTDPDTVAQFMAGKRPQVIFSTYASSEVIEAAQQRQKCPRFDLVICDEAHRCASHLNGPWSTVVRPDAIKAKYRLFMTATPRIFRVPKGENGEDVEAASMDDAKLFGPVFYNLPFSKAVKLGLLCDYRVAVTIVTDKDVARLIRSGKHIKIGKDEFKARELALHIAVDKAATEHKIGKMISFHSRIYKAKDFSHKHRLTLKAVGSKTNVAKVWVNHMSAAFDSQERLRILTEFENQPPSVRALLTNARCLTEGVDVPTVDGVVFADPRESVIAITQAIGRAMRTAPGKTIGTVVVPVFIEESKIKKVDKDHVWDDVLSESSYHTLRRVMLALRAQDDEIETVFSKLTMRTTRNSKNVGRIQITPRYVTKEEYTAGFKAGKMIEAPEDRGIVDRVSGGRTYDFYGREVVIQIPKRILMGISSKFVSSIINRIVKWNSSRLDENVIQLIDFIKKNKRLPSKGSHKQCEKKIAMSIGQIRNSGRKYNYHD